MVNVIPCVCILQKHAGLGLMKSLQQGYLVNRLQVDRKGSAVLVDNEI